MSKTELLNKSSYNFDDLIEITEILRAPGGCPWDMEQTHQSIRKGLIEETYEVIEGIDKNDMDILKEELGDLILQVVFHASIANSNGKFNINDVCDGVCKKLIYRHPHVFSTTVANTSEEVLKNWEALKQKEKGQKSKKEVMESVSTALPSLMRAQKLIKKSGEPIDNTKATVNIERYLNDFKESGDSSYITKIVFECSRLANSYNIDLEQQLFVQNDEFCEQSLNKR